MQNSAVILAITFLLSSTECRSSSELTLKKQTSYLDRARAIFFYEVPPQSCTARWGTLLFEGFCDTLLSCAVKRGVKVGVCPKGPICCLVTASCGDSFSSQDGYFLNRDYSISSSTSTSSPYCEVRLRKYDSKTCQVRLDFDEFDINQPDSIGNCTEGFLEVVGSDPNYKIPRLCGENSDQHMYISYPQFGGDIFLRMKATNAKWKIKITQISCIPDETPASAPAGCLQYYSDATDIITSFNYYHVPPRQLLNLDYEICVEKFSVACNITWIVTTFNLSSQMKEEALNNGCPTTGSVCLDEGNYIHILRGTRNPILGGCFSGRNRKNNMYCGTAISTVDLGSIPGSVPEAKEFHIVSPYPRMQVVTSPQDASTGNGFRLNYERSC